MRLRRLFLLHSDSPPTQRSPGESGKKIGEQREERYNKNPLSPNPPNEDRLKAGLAHNPNLEVEPDGLPKERVMSPI